jgi:hypothetical protein
LLALFEFLLIIFAIGFVITQITIPAMRGEKMFWLFRRKAARLEVEDLREKLQEQKVREEAEALRSQLSPETQTQIKRKSMKNKQSGATIMGQIILFASIVLCIILVMCLGQIVEHIDANEILVVQSLSGNLAVYTDAGFKPQWFGKCTHYKKSDQFWFSAKKDQGNTGDESIRCRFNDGGHANISGSVRVDLPTDSPNMLALHTKYGSQDAVMHQLVRTVLEKSVYMTGPLMSSKQSANERRNDLLSLIEDQAVNGVYQTVTRDVRQKDPITEQDKTVTIVELKKGEDGKVLRQEESPIKTFGLRMYNLSLNEVKYEDTVEKQIAQQQDAIMQVQTAMANAKRAEQEVLTVAKQGEANAAKAKWEQEVIKAKAITEAEMKLGVAELERKAAEQTKMKEIALGEGEAKRKQLVMEANGALDVKLEAYKEVNFKYAEALSKVTQPLVPSVVMGGGGAAGNTTMDLMQLLQVKTARDLAIDFQIEKGKQK